MLVLIAAIAIAAAVGVTQPTAVKAIGKGIGCAVTFGHAKMCKAKPAPAATTPAVPAQQDEAQP